MKPAIIVLIAAVAGCLQPGDESLPVVQLQLDKESIDASENVTVRAFLENTSIRVFKYRSAACDEPRVYAEGLGMKEGRAFLQPPGEPRGCAAAIVDAQLRPGERLEATYVWNGSSNPNDPTAGRAPASDYSIVGYLDWLPDGGWDVTARKTVRLVDE